MKSTRGILTIALVGGAAILSACSASVSVGGKSIDEAKLEEQVATQLQEQVGADEAPNIDCPGDLKAEVDKVMHCTLTTNDSEDEYDVRVTVTSVEGKNAKFDIEVADEPN